VVPSSHAWPGAAKHSRHRQQPAGVVVQAIALYLHQAAHMARMYAAAQHQVGQQGTTWCTWRMARAVMLQGHLPVCSQALAVGQGKLCRHLQEHELASGIELATRGPTLEWDHPAGGLRACMDCEDVSDSRQPNRIALGLECCAQWPQLLFRCLGRIGMDWRLPGPLWQAAGPERVHDYSWHYEPWSPKELFFHSKDLT
jgi:hypothetical protein